MPDPVLPVTKQIWPLVVVGRGSSAAYYVCTLDLSVYKNVLAIGEDDPWAGKRGHSGDSTDPTLKINHPIHLLEHFRNTVPGFSTELVDRLDWANKNKAVLEECNVQIHQAKVTMISEVQLPEMLGMEGELGPLGFKIEMESAGTKEELFAYKVVMCAGTGGHRVPKELEAARKNYPKQILDLDEFAGLTPRDLTERTDVIVIGSNAAIDGVHKALNYKCKVDWLIELTEPTKPGMLGTQPRMIAAWNEPDKHKLNVHRFDSYSFGTGGTQMQLVVKLKSGKERRVYGNYIAYGVGPDGGPTKVIENTIQAKLKPIVDSVRALNSSPNKPATILGYEAVGTGLKQGFEVFGAMSGSIGREIANSKDRLKVLDDQIAATRKVYKIYEAITTANFPVKKPFLARDPGYLATQPRGAMYAQLKTELNYIARKNLSDSALKYALEILANQMLAYHTASEYAKLPADDPNSLTKFRDLLNQVATHLPSGAVADHGQLTSINAALGAYATIRGSLPKYMPKQQFVSPGPVPKGQAVDVSVTNTPGDINFNLDNAQNLAIYVCLSFPNISAEKANGFVDKVLAARKNSKIGFTDADVLKYKKELAELERDALIDGLKSLR